MVDIASGILAGGQGLARGIESLGNQWRDEREKAAFIDLLAKSGLGGQPLTLASLTQPMQFNPIPAPQPSPAPVSRPQAVAPPVSENARISGGLASEFGNKWAATPGQIGGAVPAMAGVPAQAPGQPQRMAYAPQNTGGPASLIQSESGGNWGASNNVARRDGTVGHFGRLQFSQPRLAEAAAAGAIPQGVTPQQFMQSPELQQRAEAWHFADIENFIRQNGYDRLVGQPVNGVPITVDGMKAVAHLGGKEGLRRFIETGGRYNPSDANGTSLMSYLAQHGGQSGNRLASVPPMAQGGGSTPQAPQQPMTLAGLTQPPQQPRMDLATLGALATNKYGAPIAAMLMQREFGRDPIQQQLQMIQLAQAQRGMGGFRPATEAEKTAAGYAANIPVQIGPDGKMYADSTAARATGNSERSLTPVYGTDAQGNTVLLQTGKDGTAVSTKLPPGVKVSAGVEKIDAGTEWLLYDKRTGTVVGRQPKDIVGKEAAEEIGKSRGIQAAGASGAISKGQDALTNIDNILKDPAFSASMFGGGLGSPGMLYRNLPGTAAYGFGQRMEQLKGGAFLEAFTALKGGGAITEVEGKKAEAAIARLDAKQSPEDLRKALEEFKGVISRGVAKAQEMGTAFGTVTGSQAAAAREAGPKIGELQDGYRYKGGNPADPASWVKAK